jgi:hypothetical protein
MPKNKKPRKSYTGEIGYRVSPNKIIPLQNVLGVIEIKDSAGQAITLVCHKKGTEIKSAQPIDQGPFWANWALGRIVKALGAESIEEV